MQEYSILTQVWTIAGYAAEHGFEVVKTYSDDARSGLTFHGRPALGALIEDVVAGRADFGTVLVYDVSRWGRFQDADEGAHYEFLCRQAGVDVTYCAEPFLNDGTPSSSIIKGLKRLMAAEYSRNLSERAFAGHVRNLKAGYGTGAVAIFGMRRMLVDQHGKQKGVLDHGERKLLLSDRVTLVPGPAEEVRTVRWIFRQIAASRKPTEIARELNRSLRSQRRRPWNSEMVMDVVDNEKYIGNIVYNRKSAKLAGPRVKNPPEKWIRRTGQFAAVVEPRLFDQAQRAIAGWTSRISDEGCLELLADLLKRRGSLTGKLIDTTRGMPGANYYAHRFGSLLRAYTLVGYVPERRYARLEEFRQRLRKLTAFRAEVGSLLCARGHTVTYVDRGVFELNGSTRLATGLGRPVVGRPGRWAFQVNLKHSFEGTLVAGVNEGCTAFNSFWLVEGSSNNAELGMPHLTIKSNRAGTIEELAQLVIRFHLTKCQRLLGHPKG